ncbi:MAG: Rho termination factor N-terminal domain-containing protein [Acidimicrobiia bacterium]
MPKKSGPGPSVKDPDRYEALRREGMSKEKAARIANTPPKQAARRRERGGSYEEWTKQELYDKAKDVGIEGRSKMSKRELIKALRSGSRS